MEANKKNLFLTHKQTRDRIPLLKKITMKTLLLCFILLCGWFNSLVAQIATNQLDSLVNSLPTIANDKEKLFVLNSIAWNISYNDFQLGINYAFKAVEVAKKINHPQGLSKAYNTLGTIYSDLGMYDEAIKYYKLTLEINNKNNFKDGNASTYANIGNIYGYQNNNILAKQYFLLSNKQFKERNKLDSKIKTDLSLSTVFKELNMQDSAEYYLTEAFKTAKKTENDAYLIACLHIFKSRHELEKNNYAEALLYLQSAEEKFVKLNSTYDLFQIYSVYGELYYQQKKYSLAIKYYNKALNEYAENTSLALKSDVYKKLSDSYAAIQNYADAYKSQTAYIVISDSINKETSKNQLLAIENAYKNEKTQLELDNLRNTTHLQKVLIEKQNAQKIAMAIGLFLSITLAFFIFRSYTEKKKANDLITAQKLEVEKQKTIVEKAHLLLEEKNTEIIASIRYAKRIQDALMTSQKYIERNINRLKSL